MKRTLIAATIALLGTTAAVAVAPMHLHGHPASHVRLADDPMHYHGTPLADGSTSNSTNMYHHG